MPKLAGPAFSHGSRPRVLFLSKTFPNKVFDVLGLWVENLVLHSVSFCEPKVISPVQYCPPLRLPDYYSRLRSIPLHCSRDGVEVFHPRYLVGPGYTLRSVEWATYYLAVRRQADQLRREFPFDLIHAHFTYPDGCAAVRDSILRVVSAPERMRVIPNAVDGTIFALPTKEQRLVDNQIIFVGAIRPVKGVDVLLRATRLLVESGREVSLLLVGESFFKNYEREYDLIRRMTHELDLEARVQFVGKRRPPELVRCIQESAVLVLPSRAESFGMVLVEALACGTPVVATRCGGPEDIVNEKVGILVPPEDPQALAAGIAQVLDRRSNYVPEALRSYALQHFGLDSVGHRLKTVYDEALDRFHVPPSSSNHGS